jgi:hypothetical protein
VKITFDTNTLDHAARPKLFPKDPPEFMKVHDAIVAGTAKGYFSETLITLEGIQNKDRVSVLGDTWLERQIRSTGQTVININLTVRQERKPLHEKVFARIHAARQIGMRALRGPARVGEVYVEDPDETLFEPDRSEEKLAKRLNKTAALARAIEARGAGFAVASSLAAFFAKRDGTFDIPWSRSLRRARDIHEQRQVQRAIAEWADADSIAAHIAYDIDLFCTEDHGKRAGAPSVFDCNNRTWLEKTYGVKFVTFSELAQFRPGLVRK